MDRTDRPIIKICGLRSVDVALTASEAGATAIGFMLADSRRRVTVSEVTTILSALPASRPSAVGVFVNEPPGSLNLAMEASGMDIAQLSGDETPDVLGEIKSTAWKTLRFPLGTNLDEASRMVEDWLAHSNPPAAILIDAAIPGSYGGTGHRSDWVLAGQLSERYPVILAGGLDPDNVGDAVRAARPAGVDVSSGVETDGTKSPGLIRTFVERSKAAFTHPKETR